MPASPDLPANIHGCAILVGSLGILVIGPPGSGKSSLCLSSLRRGASLGLSARLVADDRVVLTRLEGHLEMSAHPRLYGLIEIFGVGILTEAAIENARLSLIVELRAPDAIERMPEAEHADFHGVSVRRVALPLRQSAFGADILVSLALGSA